MSRNTMLKPLALAAVLLASAPAFASTTSIRFLGRDATDPVLDTSMTGGYATGALSYTDANGASFIAYCVEPEQPFALSLKSGGLPNFKTYTVDSFSGAQGTLLQALYSTSFNAVHTGNQQAGFQLAVWEIMRETSGPLNIAQNNGNFFLKTSSLTGGALDTANDVQSLANGYLNAALNYQGAAQFSLVKLTNGTYQDLVTATPLTVTVPEPQTYAMLLAGLGAVGLIARRRLPR